MLIGYTAFILLTTILMLQLVNQYRHNRNIHFLVLSVGFFFIWVGLILRVVYIFFPEYEFLMSIYRSTTAGLVSSLAILMISVVVHKKLPFWLVVVYFLVSVAWFVSSIFIPLSTLKLVASFTNSGSALIVIVLSFYIYTSTKTRGALLFMAAMLVLTIGGMTGRYSEILLVVTDLIGMILLAFGVNSISGSEKDSQDGSLFGGFGLKFNHIQARLLVGFFMVILVYAGIFSYVNYQLFKNQVIESAVLQLEGHVGIHANELEKSLAEYKKTVLFLSEQSSEEILLQGCGDTYMEGTESYKSSLDRLEKLFSSLMLADPTLMQTRFIDKDGQEVIRVDFDGENVMLVTGENLQYKGDRYYFEETKKLSEGEIYVSDLDLNKEGVPPTIQEPHVPVIRYASPVYCDRGEFGGIIIVNVFLKSHLAKLGNAAEKDYFIGDDYLVNKKGFYIYNPDDSKRWGDAQNLGHGANLKQDFPGISEEILVGGNGTGVRVEADYVAAYAPVYPDCCDKENPLIVIEVEDKNSILRPVYTFLDYLMIAGVLGFVFVYLLSYVVSRSISRPIERLKQGVELVEQGDLDYKVATEAEDEIGQLSRAFDKMTESIRKSQEEIKLKVKEQTSEIKHQHHKTEKALIQLEEQKEELQRMVDAMVGRELKMVELKQELSKFKGEENEVEED